jgi:hypothetical protein
MSSDGIVLLQGMAAPDWRKHSRYLYVSFKGWELKGRHSADVVGVEILDKDGLILDFFPTGDFVIVSYQLVTIPIPKKHLRTLQ